jgi:threonyl-tRNA synthetase
MYLRRRFFVIPSEVACRAVALCEGREESLNKMSDERKTLEQRVTMSDIERLRHSASHVLAAAILKIWPEAQFAARRRDFQG